MQIKIRIRSPIKWKCGSESAQKSRSPIKVKSGIFGSRKGRKSGSGLGIKKTRIRLKYFYSLMRDLGWNKFGSGMEKIRIRDPG
jgi:hypothetical protein